MRELAIQARPVVGTVKEYGVAWIAGNPNTTGDITNGGLVHSTTALSGLLTSLMPAGQWDWVSNSDTPTTITVSIPDLTSFANSASILRLVGWDKTINKWVDLSGSALATGLTENSTVTGSTTIANANNIVAISVVKVGPVLALGVDLISFDANRFEDVSNLTWKTANEKDFSHFEILKSTDTKEFISIGKVYGNNSKNGIYNFLDSSPIQNEINYYRLNLVENNGSSKLSKIVFLNFKDVSEYISVENPASNGEFMVFSNLENPTFKLINGLNQKIEISVYKTANNQYKIKTLNSSFGIYYIVLEANNHKQIRKILIP